MNLVKDAGGDDQSGLLQALFQFGAKCFVHDSKELFLMIQCNTCICFNPLEFSWISI